MAAKGYSSSSEFIDALVLGINDNKVKKSLFDTALLNDDFSLINYCIWEIPYEISFAVSMQYEPTFDLAGNQINDYEHDEILKSIYLNVFPADGKSYGHGLQMMMLYLSHTQISLWSYHFQIAKIF